MLVLKLEKLEKDACKSETLGGVQKSQNQPYQ